MLIAESKNEKTSNLFVNPLQISVFGFEPKAIKSLEIAFSNYGENCATIVEEKQAEAAIFDFDVLESRRAWIRFKTNYPNIPTVVVCSKSVQIKDGYLLLKPLRVGKFIAIFKEILEARNTPEGERAVANAESNNSVREQNDHQEVASESSGQKQELDAQKPAAPPGYYDPKQYLQGMIQSAVDDSLQNGHVAELIIKADDDWLSIKVLPRAKKVVCELKKTQLKYLCTSPLYCLETKLVKHKGDEGKKLEQLHLYDADLIALETFIWNVALWTCDSQLPNGIDLDANYGLSRWPNFTRMKMVPNGLPMSAMLVEKPMNLKLFIKVLNLPVGEVFTFLSCAHAIGLLVNSGKNSSETGVYNHELKSNTTRSIFKKLVSKLRLK